MTRKHFIATAEIIKGIDCPLTRAKVAQKFALMFERENSNFDEARFLTACNVES